MEEAAPAPEEDSPVDLGEASPAKYAVTISDSQAVLVGDNGTLVNVSSTVNVPAPPGQGASPPAHFPAAWRPPTGEPREPVPATASWRPFSRRLAEQCDTILAHVKDPSVPFRRFDVVGDAGSGLSALLREIELQCSDRDLLVLRLDAPRVTYAAGDSAQDREQAGINLCTDLIAGFTSGIHKFIGQHPESAEAAGHVIEDLMRTRNTEAGNYYVQTNIYVDKPADTNRAGGEDARIAQWLAKLRSETEEALLRLARDYGLAILIDDVHLLDRTPAQDWLKALLRRIPARCIVTTRHLGSDFWPRGLTYDDQTLEIRNMDLAEVQEYLKDRGIAFTAEDARKLFDLTDGHGFAVATWCGLALESGAAWFTELVDRARQVSGDPDFTRLIGAVQRAVDQIPEDVLGYPVPLFALLTIAQPVTPGLIAMLEGPAGAAPSPAQAQEIYRRLGTRRFISRAEGDTSDDNGVYLCRAISDVARQRLREDARETFLKMHSYAELAQRERADIDARPDVGTPWANWSRFEDPAWIRDVRRWLDHVQWLDGPRFEKAKPALVKLYLDAFWWWDDYLRSLATRLLRPALKNVALQQGDSRWMNDLEKFSDNWVSSWDDARLRRDPRKWRAALDAIRDLLSLFGLQRGDIPEDPERRRIYVLLCQFHGKASWYAGEADDRRARAADEWLTAAALACPELDGEGEPYADGWIGSWALLRQAEIWSELKPARAREYLAGLEKRAVTDDDLDVRIGIALVTGDLRWRDGEYESAFGAYSRALFTSYTYNVRQESRKRAPNLYTKSLYAAVIGRVDKRVTELRQAGEVAVLDRALGTMRQEFEPYWDRVRARPSPPPEPSRFALPVPPPPRINEISMLERSDEESMFQQEYVAALLELLDEAGDRPLE